MKHLQVVLGFDMETDVGSFTPYYRGLHEGTPRILDVLRDNGVTATFYFTGEAAKESPETLKSVLAEGHEIGTHSLFHETMGDALFPVPGLTPLLPEEVPNRLNRCTELIEGLAGVRPVSFRSPRLFGSTAIVNALEELGYLSDASYPMYFYRDRLRPYHPCRDDWTQEGDLRLVEIPNFADLSMNSTDPYGRDMDQWPLFRTESTEALMAHIDGFTAFAAGRGVDTPMLCFYLHPWEFVAMPENSFHYGEATVIPDTFITKNCGDYAVRQLDVLVKQLKSRGAEFLQAQETGRMV
jgi:peptidoglycan/xylan/chitin deacetylase (PgdA/CDA1 family)